MQHSTHQKTNDQAKITAKQLRLLHALWHLQALDDDDREQRLRWASRNLGRTVSTFSDLTAGEFRKLREALELGQFEAQSVRL
ncbi:MAG TPA: hypothetical protein VNX88_12965 [Terriglobales bacterium]|nr:hypothetical protein [Terriglobales bacterium]